MLLTVLCCSALLAPESAGAAPASPTPRSSQPHYPPPFLASLPYGIVTFEAVTCTSPYWCAFVLGTRIGKSQVTTLAFAVTIDGGHSWYENPFVVYPTLGAQVPVASTRITGLACPTVENCVVVGYSPSQQPLAYFTTDAGRYWQHAKLPSSLTTGEVLTSVSCSGFLSCIAVGSLGQPLLSGNSGQSWSLGKPYPGGIGQLWGISCPQGECLGLVGTGTPNELLATHDAGATWKRAGSIGSSAPFALSCVSVGTCVAVGTTSVYLGPGGGTSWSAGRFNPKNATGFESVSCASAVFCVAVGTSDASGSPQPVVTFTNDGGRSWH